MGYGELRPFMGPCPVLWFLDFQLGNLEWGWSQASCLMLTICTGLHMYAGPGEGSGAHVEPQPYL